MKKITTPLALLVTFTGSTQAQTTGTRKKQFNTNKSGLALNGYAPVAYFAANKATEGKKKPAWYLKTLLTALPANKIKHCLKPHPGNMSHNMVAGAPMLWEPMMKKGNGA